MTNHASTMSYETAETCRLDSKTLGTIGFELETDPAHQPTYLPITVMPKKKKQTFC